MKIPYGLSNFADIRRGGYFYADKTTFLPTLESAETGYRYLVFLRPRRFGKSTLVSMLEHYYDIACADQFDELFQGLWIHEHPTPEKGRYLALTLDFSSVHTSGGPDALYRSRRAPTWRVRSTRLLSRSGRAHPLPLACTTFDLGFAGSA